MDFINKLKDKQKDQSAKNWFDLGVQTKSLDKKVQYFTKCLLLEPENVQALRLLADAQEELGLIDAAIGSRARADEIEGSSGMLAQKPESYTKSNSFDSDSFTSETMFTEAEKEKEDTFMEEATFLTPESNATTGFETPASETEEDSEISDTGNDKWAIFEIAKENEAKRNEELFSTGSPSFPPQETNVVAEEPDEAEEQPATTNLHSTNAEPETSVRTKSEPVVVKKQAEEEVAAPAREKNEPKPVAERPISRHAPTKSSEISAPHSSAIPQAMPQSGIPEPVSMKLPMGEIIKFWAVGAVVLLIVGVIINYLTA